jgi:hypothetical protein
MRYLYSRRLSLQQAIIESDMEVEVVPSVGELTWA